jgi:hypothetical protein
MRKKGIATSGNKKTRSELIAFKIFKEIFGYSVEWIPESELEGEHRADIKIDDGDCQYIVEVKERLNIDSQLQRENFVDDDGEYSVYTEGPKLSQRLKKVWENGSKQLNETPRKNWSFQLLFQSARGPMAEITIRRSLEMFYGIATLSPTSHKDPVVNCVYFNYNRAQALPSVNGLFLMENTRLWLCINEFSENYEDFRKSDLARKMGNAIYDPSTFNDREDIIVYDGDTPRKNETAILDELERKYSKQYRKIEMYRPVFEFDQEK